MMGDDFETGIHKYYWSLLNAVHRNQLVDKTNIVVLWCHYVMERNGFKNAGLGDDDDTAMPRKSEILDILPDGWNDILPCRIRYVFENTLYLLSVNIPDDDGWVLVKFKRPRDNKMSFSGMNLHEVPKVKGGLEEVLPNFLKLMDRFNRELVNPLISPHSRKYVAAPRGVVAAPPNRFGFARPPRSFFSEVNPMSRGPGMVFQAPGMRVEPNFMPAPPVSRGAIPRRIHLNPIEPVPGQSNVRGPVRIAKTPNDQPRPGPSGDNPNPDNPAYPGYRMFS